jgi:hypothetical protein
MDEITPRYTPQGAVGSPMIGPRPGMQPQGSLVDVLDRVLDKGLVIAGDIAVNLLDIELLTIKVRLVIASVDKAKEMGIDWWQRDPQLTSSAQREDGGAQSGGSKMDTNARLMEENRMLRERLARLESKVNAALPAGAGREPQAASVTPARRTRAAGG